MSDAAAVLRAALGPSRPVVILAVGLLAAATAVTYAGTGGDAVGAPFTMMESYRTCFYTDADLSNCRWKDSISVDRANVALNAAYWYLAAAILYGGWTHMNLRRGGWR